MRSITSLVMLCGVLITSNVYSAQSKKISWILRTSSPSTGNTISLPSDKETTVLLLPEIAKEWTCIIDRSQLIRNGTVNERSLTCYYKNDQGYFESFVKNMSDCLLDGTKQGTELAHITIGVVTPPKTDSIIYMDIDLFCEAK